jgi:hypothetical protein
MFEFRLYTNMAVSKARDGPFRDSVVKHHFKIDLKKFSVLFLSFGTFRN